MKSVTSSETICKENSLITLGISLFLVITTFSVYWQVRDHSFVNFDDLLYVKENPSVRAGLTLENVRWAFTTPYATNWHPLTWLSHMLDVEFYGMNPGPHHLTNLLFHIANTLLLFFILKRMTGQTITLHPSPIALLWPSAFVAALFALHPLHVESVAWVSERKDVLSTFFWMLTLWAYARYAEAPKWDTYLLTILFFALGLMAKPMLVTLPFVLLLLDYWPLNRNPKSEIQNPKSETNLKSEIRNPKQIQNSKSEIRNPKSETNSKSEIRNKFEIRNPKSEIRNLKLGDRNSEIKARNLKLEAQSRTSRITFLVLEKLPFFILAVLSSVVTFIVQRSGGAMGDSEMFPLTIRVTNALVAYASYLWKMIFPSKLAVYYPYSLEIPGWKMAAACLVLASVSLLIIRNGKTYPYLIVGWLWYVGTLVPVIGLVQVGTQAMADRYTYIPLIGIFIMIAWGVPDLLEKRFQSVSWKIAGVPASAILLIFTVTTWEQVGHWRDTVTLFRHTLKVTTDNPMAHSNMGAGLAAQGRTDEAIFHYGKALRLAPDYVKAHNNLGLLLADQGDTNKAIFHYKEALRISPDSALAHNNLGIALEAQGKTDEAIFQYGEALRLNPGYAKAHNNLGTLLAVQGKIDEAARHLSDALRADPYYAEAHYNMGKILADQGRIHEAIARYAEAIRLDPDDPSAYTNMGVALLRVGRKKEAMAHFRNALQKDPDHAEALANLKNISAEQEKIKRAMTDVQERLRLVPDQPDLHYELGNLCQQIGESDKAIVHYRKALSIHPGFVPALHRLTILHAVKGEYDEAISLLKEWNQLEPDSPDAPYYIASIRARQNQPEEAVMWLKRAVERGYKNWELLKTDANLENVRDTSYYKELVKRGS